jgi:hypothetical protein
VSYASFSRTPALSYFGVAPPGPVFRLDCKSGCDPVAFSPVSCQPNLDRIIREACSLALNAVRKLKERDSFTAGEFTRFFGHALGLPLPWPGLRDSGTRFAIRYRAVAEALRHAGTFYRCDNCIQLREDPPEGAVLDAHAIALPPNEVVLCPSFWQLPLFLQAGVILHEMFHLRFDPCFTHGPCERKRTSAYCYEGFALRVAGHLPEPLVLNKCAALKT